MTAYDAAAVVVAAILVGSLCLLRRAGGTAADPHGRATRFVLWLAIASPLPFLLLAPPDRFRLLVRGSDGMYEGFQLMGFAAASAGVVLSLMPYFASWWSNALVVAGASLIALGCAILYVR